MSNNPNDPDDPANEDSFDSERLPDVQQSKAFRNAQKRRAESFTSFSEGTQGIDKFKILGAEREHPALSQQKTVAPSNLVRQDGSSNPDSLVDSDKVASTARKGIMRQSRTDDAFTSFSEGLPTVDKFGILDPEANKVMPLMTGYLSNPSCRFLAPYLATAGATIEKKAYSTSETGSSKTLNRLMFLFDTLPWCETVRIELSEKPQFIEYSFDEHMMVLNKLSSDEQTILNFAHQAYHSTNRLLTKLYGTDRLDREGFIDLYMWAEVAALVTELNVRKELGITSVPPPKVLCQESSGSIYSVSVEEILKSRGMKILHDVLFYSTVRGTEDLSLVYVFGELFDIYDQTYESELPIARQYIDLCLSAGLEKDCI